MRRVAFAVALSALLLSGPAAMGQGGVCGSRGLDPFAFEAITVSTTSIGFTTGTFDPGSGPATVAIATVESNALRYRADGLAPTSTEGHAANPEDALTVCGLASIRKVRFIRSGAADATLRVTYYRE